MDKYLKLIVAMHDTCQLLNKWQSPYWPYYQKWAEKHSKAALNAEKAAIDGVTFYADATGSEKYSSYYLSSKTRTSNYVKDSRVWRDSIDKCILWLSTNGGFTSGKVKYRSMKAVVKNLNYYMDKYITPQSDPNNTQYQRYRSMQDEVNSWESKLSEWHDSVYHSRYRANGYVKVHIEKANWAEKELNKMTPENAQKAKTASFNAARCKSYAEGYISTEMSKAVTAANEALSDAKKKTNSGATEIIGRDKVTVHNPKVTDLNLVTPEGLIRS